MCSENRFTAGRRLRRSSAGSIGRSSGTHRPVGSHPAACRRAARGAFSLVELIVVMVIIGLLASLVAFRTRSYLIASKQNAAKAEIARIVQALDSFYAVQDRYPSNEEGLAALVEASEAFPDGLLNKVPLDPWKHPYQYNNPGRHSAHEVICLGADGREGGTGADRDLSSENVDRAQR